MLKQLKLRAELKQRQAELDKINFQKAGFKTRQAELEASLEEAKTDEDTKLVEDSIDTLDKEVTDADVDTKISNLTSEITRIENEITELEKKSNPETPKIPEKSKEERGINMNKYQVRELLKTGEYYERAEVKEFYEKFKNLRAVTGEGLTIPDVVVNRILDILGDYSTLYPLVDKIKVKGTTRILIDTDTTAATWLEQKGALQNGDAGTITNVDFDGFKVGKVTFVDNCMLEDSIINLDDYVSKKLARSIALALDLSILNGTGTTGKQPEGIIPALATKHSVTVTDPAGVVDIVKPIALIDDGEDSMGEIVAVMKRTTYYNRLLGYSVQTNANGNVVGKLPNLSSPDILGLRVVFNKNMADDKILFGDFNKYTLVERESITVDKSEHVKFSEDQMGFRGKGRFDGKPTNKNAFALVTLAFTPVG